MKVCPNCKKEYSDNSNFCDVCGSALTVVDESISSQQIQQENPKPLQMMYIIMLLQTKMNLFM